MLLSRSVVVASSPVVPAPSLSTRFDTSTISPSSPPPPHEALFLRVQLARVRDEGLVRAYLQEQESLATRELAKRDRVETSVGSSSSLVGTVVGNSSDAVINGRTDEEAAAFLAEELPSLPSSRRRVTAKMLQRGGVINQGADILFLPRSAQKRFSFYLPRRA